MVVRARTVSYTPLDVYKRQVYEEDRRMLAKHLADICEGKENVHNLHYRLSLIHI